MLTYTSNPKPKRKDRPWLLFVTALIWIAGSCFFHDPWEPYEPYIVAIVKSIINTNSWLVPYISSNSPYLDLQPFYFWIFAVIVKIFNFTDVANAVRLINAFIIFAVIAMMGRIGSGLSAFKNGRTVVMILISTVGFVNNAYQLSPHLVVILGFTLYIYSLQNFKNMPGSSAGILAIGLVCISLHFTAQYISIALFILLLLPIISSSWRRLEYFITIGGGLIFFLLVFTSYAWQLHRVDAEFYYLWQKQYLHFFELSHSLVDSIGFYLIMLSWYVVPGWFLVFWTIYKRKKAIFKDPIAACSILMLVLFFIGAIFSGAKDESVIFPIIIPIVLLASLEVDSIKITIVSLFNWFSIFVFGSAGLTIAMLYIALGFGYPQKLFHRAQYFAPNYLFNFNFWQVLLAVLITIIWLFMITRKHIRGREMISNWASGSTFVLVMFISLCIPWFNSVLSFRDLVNSSMIHVKLNVNSCVATNSGHSIQNAIWYYYSGLRLVPESNIANTSCDQAIVTMMNNAEPVIYGWHIIWRGRRPVDFKTYYLMNRD